MKKTIKAAIVGTGFIGKQHYEAIRRLPNTEVVAIVETDAARAQQFAEEFGIDQYFTDFDDLLELSELDVIHICTPNFLHFPMSKKALEKNIHVFCEKPLSLTAQESKELVETAKNTKTLHAVNLNYRSNAMVREMKARHDSESFGDLLLVNAQYIQDWLMYDTDYDWHFVPEMVGPSRTVADIGTHIFDLIQFVSGQEIMSIFADLITVYPKRKKCEASGETFAQTYTGSFEEVDIVNEDAAIIIAKLANGVKVSINLSQISGGFKNGLALTLSGSKESITWEQESADRLKIGKRDYGNEMIYADAKYLSDYAKPFVNLPNGHAVGWADAFKNSIGEFYLQIRNGTQDTDSYVDFNKGHQLMRLVEACLLSNESRSWVDVHE